MLHHQQRTETASLQSQYHLFSDKRIYDCVQGYDQTTPGPKPGLPIVIPRQDPLPVPGAFGSGATSQSQPTPSAMNAPLVGSRSLGIDSQLAAFGMGGRSFKAVPAIKIKAEVAGLAEVCTLDDSSCDCLPGRSVSSHSLQPPDHEPVVNSPPRHTPLPKSESIPPHCHCHCGNPHTICSASLATLDSGHRTRKCAQFSHCPPSQCPNPPPSPLPSFAADYVIDLKV